MILEAYFLIVTEFHPELAISMNFYIVAYGLFHSFLCMGFWDNRIAEAEFP
jgi:hypothetical protein